jgi:peptidoglycan/xylan/chitin deacetylase (PgdA/CDA1 family)
MTRASGLNFHGKRELLARGLFRSGASFMLSQLPGRSSLLILNYHRIGNPEEDLFDPGVFSATADQFDDQISYLKRRVLPVTLEEALDFVDGNIKEKSRCCRLLITFDDGYRDNYDLAYPILQSHGVQGVFFLATGLVGSCHLPWWDHIAYVVKTAQKRQFTLHYPADLVVNIDQNGLEESLRAILALYKRPDNADPARFIQEMADETKGKAPPKTQRRFLDWNEAREMIAGDMAIGSHTHSHQVLSQLKPEQQFKELSQSRAILKKQLGIKADALAYPVGIKGSFTRQTQLAAREAGYRAAFSHHGGTNLPGRMYRGDINRIGIGSQSWKRFRVQTSVCSFTGKYWP